MAQRRLLVLDISDKRVAGMSADVRSHVFVPVAASSCTYADEEGVGDAVRDVVERCEGGGLRCHVALPASMLSFRNLSLPFTDRRKIDEVLHYELGDRLIAGNGEFLSDALRVGETENGTTELLAAAVDNSELASLYEVFEGLGLKVDALSVSGMALALKMIEAGYGADSDIVFLDAGTTESTLFVCGRGRVRTVRSLHGLGGERIDECAAEVRRTLAALDIGVGAPLFLGGQVGSDTDAAQRFRDQCNGMDVVLVDMEGNGGPVAPPGEELSLPVRTKLSALLQADPNDERAINLAPGRRGGRADGELKLSHRALLSIAACLMVVLVFAGYQVYDFNRIAQEHTVLDEQIRAIFSQTLGGRQPHGDPLRELSSEIASLEQSATASIVSNPNITAVELLADLSSRIPSSVRVGFDRFSFDRRRLQVDGITDGYNDVDAIRRSLADSSLYSSVSIDSARSAGDGRGVRFSLIATL